MSDRDAEESLLGGMRRAVGDALDATVGRVGHTMGEAALDVTEATAQQVIEDLEPYLVSEAIPRIVEGITPYLTESVVPEVLEGIHGHLVEVTIPEVVDGVTDHLVTVTVPAVVEGVTPRLVDDLLPRLLDDLRPFLAAEVVPQLVEELMPKIEAEVAPQLVDALMPKIREQVAPDLVDALMPKIEAEVAPQLVDALMPKIREQVAPDLVDALMPKIRAEVVPTILDDIVEDPRVRDLIREQSQGLLLDAVESIRENLADGDDIVERFFRRLLRRQPRPVPESAVTLVLDAASAGEARADATLGTLDELRASWRSMPAPPAPPGREFAHPGLVTRGIALAVDVSLTAWLIGQGLSALVSLLESLFGALPAWVTGLLAAAAVTLVPLYLAIAWAWWGRSLGSWLVGVRVCTPDGRRLGIIRSAVRAWLLVLGAVIWVTTGVVSLFDRKRRILLDMLVHTEERYLVPDVQQRRYLREALASRKARVAPPAEESDGTAAEPS